MITNKQTNNRWYNGCDDSANLTVRQEGSPKSALPELDFSSIMFPNASTDSECFLAFKCGKSPSHADGQTDDIECHNNLLTLEAAHHGHRWHFHRPSWLMHLLSLLPLLLLVRIQRYWGYRSLSATCMHLVLSKCRQLLVHSFDGRNLLSLSLVLEHLK